MMKQLETFSDNMILSVTISVKIGWEKYINERLKMVCKTYAAMRSLFRTITRNNILIRRKIFLAHALPHFIWLFSTRFYYTERQKERISNKYCSGIRIAYGIPRWDDLTTLVITREKSIYDYVYKYWKRLINHLLFSDEALAFQTNWLAYLHIKSPDRSWWSASSFRKSSVFLRRLRNQVTSCVIEWIHFENIHAKQYDYYRKSTHSSTYHFSPIFH